MRGRKTYHDVETAKLVDGALDNGGDLVLLADVALHGDGLDRELGVVEALVDNVGSLLARLEVDVGEDNVGTLGCKEDGTFTADAAVEIRSEGSKCEQNATESHCVSDNLLTSRRR